MAKFDLSSFTKTSSQSPLQSMVSSINRTASGLTDSVTGSISRKMYEAGGSLGSAVRSAVTERFDSLVRDSSSGISAISGAFGDGFSSVNPENIIAHKMSTSSSDVRSIMPETKTADSQSSTAGSGMMQYPPDLGKYYIKFEFGKYIRPNVFLKDNESAQFSAELTLSLPIPHNLAEHQNVDIQEEKLGSIQGNILNSISAAVQYIGSGAPVTGETTRQTAIRAGNLAGGSLYGAAELLPSAWSGTLGQTLGAIPNPHVTVFFNGVNLRSFSFSWRFAPKNASESALIKDIVKEIKKRMLPNKAWGDAAVLGYPQMCRLEFVPNKEYMFEFKKCLVSSVNVDYAPQGIPSFFAGTNAPTMIELKIDVQEIEYFLSEDYGGSSGEGLGDVGAGALDSFKKRLDDYKKPSS